MNDYIPDTAQVRSDFATRMAPAHDYTRRAGFDRWLEQIKREAKAEALEDAADEREHHEYQVNPWRTDTTVDQKRESASFLMQSTSSWLRDRAKQVRVTQ